MFNVHSVEIDWGGRPLKLETGKIARQADGAVIATYGETVVLATVVAAKTAEGWHRLPAADRRTTRKRPTQPAAFPAATSSAKVVRPRRRRWSPA
jgi:hypothetical protein